MSWLCGGKEFAQVMEINRVLPIIVPRGDGLAYETAQRLKGYSRLKFSLLVSRDTTSDVGFGVFDLPLCGY